MSSDSDAHLPFSQRNGLEPVPPQLKFGEVSAELRRLFQYYIFLEIGRNTESLYGPLQFKKGWLRASMDIHVLFNRESPQTLNIDPIATENKCQSLIQRSGIGRLFDFIEFLLCHPFCSTEFKRDLAGAFVTARAAYRVVDNKTIVALGVEEQAASFEQAIATANDRGAIAARKQLIAAGVALRNGDWAGSVRESIHAVEAVAVQLAPGTSTLGAALKVIEQKGHLHGSLKAAFGSLYGYSSDEEGVRHALVFEDEAQVDEADALFMLGACASFVSYLLAHVGAD